MTPHKDDYAPCNMLNVHANNRKVKPSCELLTRNQHEERNFKNCRGKNLILRHSRQLKNKFLTLYAIVSYLTNACLPAFAMTSTATILCGKERHEMRRIEDGLGKSWKVVNILLMKHSAQYCLLLLSLVTININFLITQTRCHAATIRWSRQRGITVRGQRGYCCRTLQIPSTSILDFIFK